MMAGEFEIARQTTLEAVKQTGIETQQTVNETKTTIGDIGDPAGEESLVGLVKNIPEKVPTGAVKSVQRGYIQLTDTGDPTEMQITISKIDPQKSFVILNTDTVGIDRHYGQGLCLKSLTENKLVVRSETHGGIWFSWQVIECF